MDQVYALCQENRGEVALSLKRQTAELTGHHLQGLRACRSIFGRARKSPLCTWQVFEANALMEYHCSKDVKVATKVFELALKSYGGDEAFVVRYLDFLISINDDNSECYPTDPAGS